MIHSVRIVGAGLIGTSIGLALAAKNIAVEMIDVDSSNQALAQDLTGAVSISEPELIILATPLRALSPGHKRAVCPKPKLDVYGCMQRKSRTSRKG